MRFVIPSFPGDISEFNFLIPEICAGESMSGGRSGRWGGWVALLCAVCVAHQLLQYGQRPHHMETVCVLKGGALGQI